MATQAKVLLFGQYEDLEHARVLELKNYLKKQKIVFMEAHSQKDLEKLEGFTWSWIVLVTIQGFVPPALFWVEWSRKFATPPRCALIVDSGVPASVVALKAELVINSKSSLDQLFKALESIGGSSSTNPPPVSPEQLTNQMPTVSHTQMAADALEELVLSLDAVSMSKQAPLVTSAPTASPDGSSSDSPKPGELTGAVLALDMPLAMAKSADKALELKAFGGDVTHASASKKSIASLAGSPPPHANLPPPPPGPRDLSDNSVLTTIGLLEEDKVLREHTQIQVLQEVGSPDAAIAPHSSGIAAPSGESISDLGNLNLGQIQGGHEVDTLKRYATLKEREAREKEATIEVINRQLTQMKERFSTSENERRKLTMGIEELRATIRSLEDVKAQHDHHVRKLESSHQENMRALQLRLDNAQFQANKGDKKLDEFRERVRSDILKIRLRERELANKLELQKRDAETLLQAKDERLLAQKREIDRLEFEIQNLKERMVDETGRAEDRAGKLTRALQSLKMAQGMLSGIEEEVLPQSVTPGFGSRKAKNPASGGEAA